MLKKYVIYFLLLLSFGAVYVHADETLSYNVKKKVYMSSVVFELNAKKSMIGTVVKSPFRLRTNYDLYDARGVWQASAVCRILTLGLFYDWGTELDFYDPAGAYIGMIDGQVVTEASAKFSFYDAEGSHVGIAYLDVNNTGFTIVNPENQYHTIAQYTRNFVENTLDTRDVIIYDQRQIPAELLHVFGAFAVDRQGSFKADT